MQNARVSCHLTAARVIIVLAMTALLPAAASAATNQTIKAFSVWHTDSQIAAGAAGTHVFEGTVDGPFYVETEKGPVNSGSMSCKAKLTIKDADQTQEGQADCTINGKDGATVQLTITCQGVFQIGCNGKAELTAGTGRFQGIKGGGAVAIRSDYADLKSQGISDPAALHSGLMYFPALHYQLP